MRCPACHASVGVTVAMPTLQGRWCPSCGAGVGWTDEVCPSCGMPLERTWGQPIDQQAQKAPDGPDDEQSAEEAMVSETDDTRALARIESAIPAEHDPDSKVAVQERMPHPGPLLLASFFSILFVCGLALAITHPWNPDANNIKATEEADTSMAGFPGTVESLSGQDSDENDKIDVVSGDDATYAQLVEAYGKLGRYAERADENEELFYQVAFGDDLDERVRGKREADMLAIDVSNLIELLGQVDITSGTYAGDVENLTTLGSWLRNRVDALTSAWKADVESADVAADQQRLLSLLEADHDASGQSTYKTLFDESYAQWEPVQVQQ